MANTVKLTRKELYEKVWSKPMVQLAKEFNISDVGLSKICKRFNIPRPGLGHWAKLEHGKPVHKKKLPEEIHDSEIIINLNAETKKFTPISTIDNKKAESLGEKYFVQEHLRHCHPLISKAKKALESKHTEHWTDTLSINVGKEQRHRTLRILNAVFKYMEKRGHTIEILRQNLRQTCLFVKIKEYPVGIRIREKYKQVPHEMTHEEEEHKKKYGYSFAHKYDPVYEGKLVFQIIDPFFMTNIETSDGKRKKLEDKLGLILLKILRKAKDQLERNIRKKKDDKERQRCWLQEQERLKKQREEEQKINNLEKEVENWRKSRYLRDYLKAAAELVTEKRGGYNEGSEFDLWLKWAHSYANRIDPLHIQK